MRKVMWTMLLVAIAFVAISMSVLAEKPISINSLSSVSASVHNEFIQINMSDDGCATIGTTGGDPDVMGDENKRLLYGHSSGHSTGFPSVRVVREGGVFTDYSLRSISTLETPYREGEKSTVANWRLYDVSVQQRVSLTTNPFTGREDMGLWEITATNTGNTPVAVGVRLMLDLMIGDNDFAPILTPELGALNNETDFGPDLSFYRAFESETYEAVSLRALGIVQGYGLTNPDRTVFGSWAAISGTTWDYTVDSSLWAGDSAMVYWWNHIQLMPGQSRTVRTMYGLGEGGGRTWIDAPAEVTCEDLSFEATLWVANNEVMPLTNVKATIQLPSDLSLASGSQTISLPDIPSAGTSSAIFEIVADRMPFAERKPYSVSVTYDGLQEPLVANAAIDVPDCGLSTHVYHYFSGALDRIWLIESDQFDPYDGLGRLVQISEPPAPLGWKQIGFDDSVWKQAENVWWDAWDEFYWQPIPGGRSAIIGIREDDRSYGKDGDTQLIRREFELTFPGEEWQLTQVTLTTWSDNKAVWWWNGRCILDGQEGPNSADLSPYVSTNGGRYILAVQNSNDFVAYGNPQGTAYELQVVWEKIGEVREVWLPFVVKLPPKAPRPDF